MSGRTRAALGAGALAVLAFLCFRPALGFDFVVTSDDWDYVLANAAVRAGLTLQGLRWALAAHAANWHPLTWLSHMADVAAFGMSPSGHHLTSLLLHAANAALLFLVLEDATGRPGRSFLAAAIFAVHPTRVESVVWISERKDVLCALFWMLAVWTYVRGARSTGRWRMAPALAFFSLGLLAKPMIVTLPVLLLLVDAWPLGRLGRAADLPALLREKAAFFALAAAAAVATVHAQRVGGAVQSLESFPLATRLGNAALAVVAYVRTFLWPHDLSAFYPHAGAHLSWPAAAASVAALSTATVLAVRSGRGYLAAGWLWFLVALLPVIGIVQVGEQARADRYTYVPYVGLAVVLVWGVAELLDRTAVRVPVKAALSLALVASLVAATRAELPRWRNARALFGRALELDPRNVFARQNLAVALLYDGDLAAARRHLDRVLELRPDYPFALRAAVEAASREGDPTAAMRYLERLLRVAPGDPVAATRAADLALADGDLAGALERYAGVRRAAPGFTPAAYPYALALLVAGQIDAGLEQLAFAAAGSPGRADWAAQLAGARLLAAGADGPGRRELERALAERHRALAAGLRRRGREAEAARHDAEASRLSR